MKKIKQDRDAQVSSVPSENLSSIVSQERHEVDNLVNSLLQTSLTDSPIKTNVTTNLSPKEIPNKANTGEVGQLISLDRRVKSSNLTIVKNVISYEIFPKPVESYEKECQTDELTDTINSSIKEHTISSEDAAYDTLSPQKLSHRRPAAAGLLRSDLTSSTGTPTHTQALIPVYKSSTSGQGISNKPELSQDEVKKIVKSDNFVRFIGLSSHLVERAIGQSQMFDLLRDYQKDRLSEQKLSKKGVTFVGIFTDESTRNRPIMDIQFSSHYPELFLVAYGAKTLPIAGGSTYVAKKSSANYENDNDPLGMICVWSTGVDSKPEFKFFASSPILTARFSTTDEHIIIGGCYTGQILMFDMRAKSHPIQRSSLTGNGHKHPIYSMCFVPSVTLSTTTSNAASTATAAVTNTTTAIGSQSSALLSAPTTVAATASFELVTVSVDGVLCYWDVSRLVEPSNMINLSTLFPNTMTSTTSAESNSSIDPSSQHVGNQQNLPLNITCMSFSSNQGNSQTPKEIIFGSGTGQLYRGSVPLRSNQFMSQIEAHTGLISSMQINPNTQRQYKNLLLTSSLDWSVKLWNFMPQDDHRTTSTGARHISTSGQSQSHTAGRSSVDNTLQPLLEFITPTYNYVSDVQWCPNNPCIFSTITSCGHLSIWNLCKTVSEPIETICVGQGSSYTDKSAAGVSSTSGLALNKSVWSNNGRFILLGDSKGSVHMVMVQENITAFSSSDENKFEMVLVGNNINKQ